MKTPERRRVLHVVDRVGGGVPVAVAGYIRNSPDGFEHHVLTPFVDGRAPEIWTTVPASVYDLGYGHASRWLRVAERSRLIDAHIVHAHSSFSGVYTRLAPLGRRRRVVYTPHCYSFVRTDIGSLARGTFRAIEWALAGRTDVLAACSPIEMEIGLGLRGGRGRAAVVPNVASIEKRADSAIHRRVSGALRVGMLGRVSPQKDPHAFISIVKQLAGHGVSTDAWWIGDGDTASNDLQDAGVSVTGWLTPDAVRSMLGSLDVYIHSAAWEGFPIAILDAHAAGVPILARRIAAFGDLPSELSTSDLALAQLGQAVNSADELAQWKNRNRAAWSELLAGNTLENQRAALNLVWTGS